MLSSIPTQVWVGWLIAGLSFAAGYGAMKATVDSTASRVTRIEKQVDRLVDHLAWGNNTGPAPPVEP